MAIVKYKTFSIVFRWNHVFNPIYTEAKNSRFQFEDLNDHFANFVEWSKKCLYVCFSRCLIARSVLSNPYERGIINNTTEQLIRNRFCM